MIVLLDIALFLLILVLFRDNRKLKRRAENHDELIKELFRIDDERLLNK